MLFVLKMVPMIFTVPAALQVSVPRAFSVKPPPMFMVQLLVTMSDPTLVNPATGFKFSVPPETSAEMIPWFKTLTLEGPLYG